MRTCAPGWKPVPVIVTFTFCMPAPTVDGSTRRTCGAATTVISQLPDHPLHADYQRSLRSGTKPPLARLTLARKIAAIVLSMWRHQDVYNPKRRRLAVSKP